LLDRVRDKGFKAHPTSEHSASTQVNTFKKRVHINQLDIRTN
jgi:hypothetical protein